jgi:hypothetical protein
LKRFDFSDTAPVTLGITEMGTQKSFNQLPCKRGANYLSSEAEDIHVVIFDALVGGEHVVNQSCSNAWDFVCCDRRTDAAPAERDSALYISASDGLCERNDEIGIIVCGIQLVGAEVNDLVTRGAQGLFQLSLQGEGTVVRRNSYSHVAFLLDSGPRTRDRVKIVAANCYSRRSRSDPESNGAAFNLRTA